MNWLKEVNGEESLPIIRIKPPMNFAKEDIRLVNNNLILSDPMTNRIVQEFDVQKDAQSENISLQQIYQFKILGYLERLLAGTNVNIFAYGSTGAGKTQTIEGNKKEQGLIMLAADSLFNLLENKKAKVNQGQTNITNYSYSLRIQYSEIIDEHIQDLFSQRKFGSELNIEDDSWEGPIIRNCTWIKPENSGDVIDKLVNAMRNRDNTSNEFGKISSKATSYFVYELIQRYDYVDSMKHEILKSQLSFLDLPGSEIYIENKQDEEARIRQGSTLNRVILSFTQLINEISDKRHDTDDFIMYDTSTVCKLIKEWFGNNACNIGIFCLQHGDHKGSSIALNVYKKFRMIKSFPIFNNDKVIAVFHQFRQEASSQQQNKKSQSVQDSQQNANLNELMDLRNQVNEDKKAISDLDDEKTKLMEKLQNLRAKYQELVKQKSDLQGELIKNEEDKLEISKALVEMEIENARLMDLLQKQKLNQGSKLDDDELSSNLKEEKALETIKELQERLRSVIEEKRELEMEFMALKRNYVRVNQELEEDRVRLEAQGLELINVMNENKALQEELNNLFKQTGSKTEENKKFVERLEQLESQIKDKDEAMIFLKAEIERQKVEMMRYQVQNDKDKTELDKKQMAMEKSMLNNSQLETKDYGIDENAVKKVKEEKMMWESQKMELTYKIKSLQRRIGEDGDRYKELEKELEYARSEIQKLELQIDEMRSIYRNKLIQFTRNENKNRDLEAREELVKSFNEKEIESKEKLDSYKKETAQQKLEIKALRSYGRKLRYIAEDWAPLGQQLPEILQREPPYMVDKSENISSVQEDLENEVQRLRERVKKLDRELENVRGNENINDRLMRELNDLKQQQNDTNLKGSTVEQIRQERNDLQEENRRLVSMLKDSKKWDSHLLQRENERLQKMVKELEMNSNGTNGSNSGMGKIKYFEKLTRQLEKERTELMVRATMAEEQLKQLQEHMQRVTGEYQKKILELKRQII